MNTAERHEALRAALITAAERAISASGLAGLKARELAREAGCALGAIYTVFPDLNALIFEVNGRTLSAIDAAIETALKAREGALSTSADPVERLAVLSLAYLDYATHNGRRWAALFAHSLPEGQAVPEAYLERQAKLFRYVEASLAALRPQLAGDELSLLARSLFSAVHGVVSLGLDEKLTPTPISLLRGQIRLLVSAVARGLATAPERPPGPA